jgi:hypothetical protein
VSRFAATRKDVNQPELVAALRGLGWCVYDTSAVASRANLPGWPDLLCVRAGRVVLVEIKHGKAPLTPDEQTFHAGYAGEIVVLRTIDDCVRLTQC